MAWCRARVPDTLTDSNGTRPPPPRCWPGSCSFEQRDCATPGDHHDPPDSAALLTYEWLVTNGLGGSASGTVVGANTRRFHGLLIAALPAPLGRIVMLNHLAEYVRLPDGRTFELGASEYAGGSSPLPSARS